MIEEEPNLLPANAQLHRRRLLKGALAVGVASSVATPFVRASKSLAIKSVRRRDETIIRYGGIGDIYPLTWLPDDRQFSSFSNGWGWTQEPNVDAYNTRAICISGDSRHATFQEVAGYPDLILKLEKDNIESQYYAFGALATGGRIYQFLCCDQGTRSPGWGWNGVKLIYSSDNGRTWHNQDGTTPVKWESYAERSRTSLLLYDEPQEAFSLVSLLQMGQNYEENRDGYVYGYGTNGNTDGIMNQLVMFRVPKDRLLERRAYEFFAGMTLRGGATWSQEIQSRTAVHTFPRGWVNTPRIANENVVQSWVPSVVYNAPLDAYVMACSGVGTSRDGDWFGKPSYLGFWTAPRPWGPWTQIHEELAWTPGNDPEARCYSPQIAPKWIAPDGKSLWLVWSDFQGNDKLVRALEREMPDGPKTRADAVYLLELCRRYEPYYAFNTQRFDLAAA